MYKTAQESRYIVPFTPPVCTDARGRGGGVTPNINSCCEIKVGSYEYVENVHYVQ